MANAAALPASAACAACPQGKTRALARCSAAAVATASRRRRRCARPVAPTASASLRCARSMTNPFTTVRLHWSARDCTSVAERRAASSLPLWLPPEPPLAHARASTASDSATLACRWSGEPCSMAPTMGPTRLASSAKQLPKSADLAARWSTAAQASLTRRRPPAPLGRGPAGAAAPSATMPATMRPARNGTLLSSSPAAPSKSLSKSRWRMLHRRPRVALSTVTTSAKLSSDARGLRERGLALGASHSSARCRSQAPVRHWSRAVRAARCSCAGDGCDAASGDHSGQVDKAERTHAAAGAALVAASVIVAAGASVPAASADE
mmetsp:Transcript_23232/g.87990  ORF Transcript_23232/g.87990 Transcript_23232/m.87990 type:complete len:323 (+) Transcript_23232:436-1404(+)